VVEAAQRNHGRPQAQQEKHLIKDHRETKEMKLER
jgi:hypothetical protein